MFFPNIGMYLEVHTVFGVKRDAISSPRNVCTCFTIQCIRSVDIVDCSCNFKTYLSVAVVCSDVLSSIGALCTRRTTEQTAAKQIMRPWRDKLK